MSFEIKNVDVIIIGDSHTYAGVNLEILNKNFNNLVLACATPTISINNLTNLSKKIYEKYEPKLLIIGLSAFQFMQADEKKEKERKYYYNFTTQNESYKFHFDVIKQYILHYIRPFSETDIAIKQINFLEKIKKNKPINYNDEINKKINLIIKKRYNTYSMDKRNNETQINRICKEFKNIKSQIFLGFFLDIFSNILIIWFELGKNKHIENSEIIEKNLYKYPFWKIKFQEPSKIFIRFWKKINEDPKSADLNNIQLKKTKIFVIKIFVTTLNLFLENIGLILFSLSK